LRSMVGSCGLSGRRWIPITLCCRVRWTSTC
jgi:hypothetical protein